MASWMMWDMDLIADGIALLGLLGGTFGFFYGRAARKKADEAQNAAADAGRDAAQALTRSASAHEEAAAALKRANEIEESKLPQPRIHFSMHFVSGSMYSILCDDLPANQVEIIQTGRVQPVEEGPRDLKDGDSVRFMVFPMTFGSGGGAPRLVIKYVDPANGEARTLESDLNV